nr:S41 family peptidase [uncultured Bacteroides sp.]
MRKILVHAILIISLTTSSCQNVQRNNLADKRQEKEFIHGSNIHIDSCDSELSHKLAQLCKIWGFLKYYHPAIATGKYNWDFELFRTMQSILKAPSKSDQERVYCNWIQGLGDVRKSRKSIIINPDSVKMYPELSWIEDSLNLGKVSKQLIELKFAARSGKHHYYVSVEGTMNAQFENESPYLSLSYPDAGYRLLALFRYWNAIQYYYPYRYLIKENWDSVLTRFIPLFIHAKDRAEYMRVLLKLIVCIGDTHAGLFDQLNTLDSYKRYRGAAEISFIEGKAIVVKSESTEKVKNSGLEVGDIILSINGESMEEIASRKIPDISASNYPTKLREVASNLLVTNNEMLYVEFDRNGKRESSFILCSPYENSDGLSRMQQDKPLINHITPENILYLNLGSKEGGSIPEAIDAKGIIIDLRCYPSQKVKGYWDFEQLYPNSTAFAKATEPSIETPGLFSFKSVSTVGKKNTEFFKGKKIILINEFSQSHAEFMAMKYRCAPNTLVIGSTTAGADGNVSNIVLPGNIYTSFTGLGIYYPDGRETQKIGIIPDIEVKPTIRGVRSGHDEVLDKAIELINK